MRHSGSEGFRELGIYDIFSVFFFRTHSVVNGIFVFFCNLPASGKDVRGKSDQKSNFVKPRCGKETDIFFRFFSHRFSYLWRFCFFRNLPGSGKDVREKSD